MKITRDDAKKVLEIVDQGLCQGAGTSATPGQVCVEQAVTMALGLPFSDDPKCVGRAVRLFKMELNDSNWSSNAARAKGMKRLAIAQLGSDQIDQDKFRNELQRGTIARIVPIALRAAALKNVKHASELEAAAVRCEQEPTLDSVLEANIVARTAADADATAFYADAAAAAATAATAAERDKILTISADIGLQALIVCGSPGCQWLDLCEEVVE